MLNSTRTPLRVIFAGFTVVSLAVFGVASARADTTKTTTTSPTKTTSTATASTSNNRAKLEATAVKAVTDAGTKQTEQRALNKDRASDAGPPAPLLVGDTIDHYCGTTTTTTAAYMACVKSVALTSPTPPATPTRDDAQFAVTEILVELEIPDPVINVGPDPSVNEWKSAVIGYPLWLWASEPDTRSLSVTVDGYPVTLVAHRTAVTFDMGDGSAPVTCAAMDAYAQGVTPVMQPAPNCGHTFQKRNEPGVNNTVTARARWLVDWSAMGFTGTLTLNTSAQRSIHVIELQSVKVG